MLVISVTLSMRVSADQDHSFTEVNSIKNFALYNLLVAVYTSYASVNILDTLKINRQNYLIC